MNKQTQLDNDTKIEVVQKGGHNFLYAEYLKMTAALASESDATVFDHLQPEIEYTKKDEAFWKALKYCIGYLKSYKMKETIETMKIEFPDLPKKSGYSTRSELVRAWLNYLDTIEKLGIKSFEEKVQDFADEVGIPQSKAKLKPPKM